jgi:hypothetical protein
MALTPGTPFVYILRIIASVWGDNQGWNGLNVVPEEWDNI